MRKALPDRIWSKVHKTDTCWIWQGARTSAKGHGRVFVRKDNGRNTYGLAHRLVYELTCGPIPSGMCVIHQCDVPTCVNPEHLRVGTQGENNTDRHRKGRTVIPRYRGEQCHRAKLTEEDVRAIRQDTRIEKVIAHDYGVSRQAVNLIRRRINWPHVE